MDAKAFWAALEYRICREIDGLCGVEYHGLWCDGVIPESFQKTPTGPIVVGRTCMGRGGRRQEEWRFELILPAGIERVEDVGWATLFPAEDVTGWLILNQSERFMRLNPAAAYPDPPATAD